MKGRRVYIPKGEILHRFSPGDYWKEPDGTWSCCTPDGIPGSISTHKVIEHEDGTITVEPSIVSNKWHGWLERGEWRTA